MLLSLEDQTSDALRWHQAQVAKLVPCSLGFVGGLQSRNPPQLVPKENHTRDLGR